MNNNKQLNKGDKMNGRAIIIAVLILFKVIGIASRAKADTYKFYSDENSIIHGLYIVPQDDYLKYEIK